MQSNVNHGIELSVGLATGRDHIVMTGLEGVSDPVAGFSLHKVGSAITSSSQLRLVGLICPEEVTCKCVVCFKCLVW